LLFAWSLPSSPAIALVSSRILIDRDLAGNLYSTSQLEKALLLQ
jgi:hypothetical protein